MGYGDGMTSERRERAMEMLSDAQVGVRAATENLDKALETRRFWILRALEIGVRPAEVARELGVTRARVTQIAQQD